MYLGILASWHPGIHVSMYPHIHVFMYPCLHVSISLYSCSHISMYPCIHVFMHRGILVFMYPCILCPISTLAPLSVSSHNTWQKNVTNCDCQNNRTSSIHPVLGKRKAEIGWIRPRRPSLKFYGKRFGGRVHT